MCLGEFCAFLIGWSTLVLISVGGATNARAWSSYLNSYTGNRIENWTIHHVADWRSLSRPLAGYPDFVASAVLIVLVAIVSMGANCSGKFMSVMTTLNISVLLFVSIVGFAGTKSFKNWTFNGFLPFGISGVIAGASKCFWALSGFEAIFTAVEEAKTPKRDIPIATGLSISAVTILYVMTSAAITLVKPYNKLDPHSPIPSAISSTGWEWARHIATIGPLLGLTTTLFTSIFSSARQLYAMGVDGLLPPITAKVNDCSRLPLFNIYFVGILMVVSALLFDLRDLLSMAVTITLSQYLLVSAAVVYLRYKPTVPVQENGFLPVNGTDEDGYASSEETNLMSKSKVRRSNVGSLRQCIVKRGCKSSVPQGHCVLLSILLYIVASFIFGLLIRLNAFSFMLNGDEPSAILLTIVCVALIVLIIVIYIHEKSDAKDFVVKTPCVPLIPCLSISTNAILLAVSASWSSWIVYGAVLLSGVMIYFLYGIRHSTLNDERTTKTSSELELPLIEDDDDEL
ncbi:DgyrCDS4824 [Dimorphilus gyrociliatus]|nr:DgyrCDS4824 [Dimorphilus gyrociliatus]